MRETNKQRRLPRFSPHSQHFSASVLENFLCKGWVETRLTPRKKKSDFNSLGLRRTVTVNELTAACVCVCVEEGEPAVNQKANDSVGEGVRSRSRSHTGDLPWRTGGYWTLLVLGDTTVQWLWV